MVVMKKRSVLSSVAAAAATASLLVDASRMGCAATGTTGTTTTTMRPLPYRSSSSLHHLSVPRGGARAEEKKEDDEPTVGSSSKKSKKKKRRKAKQAKKKDDLKSSESESTAAEEAPSLTPEQTQPKSAPETTTADAKTSNETTVNKDQTNDTKESPTEGAKTKEGPKPTKATTREAKAESKEPANAQQPEQQQSASTKKEPSTASSHRSSSTPPPPSLPPVVQEILKESDYYKILGLDPLQDKTAAVSVITKAYRRRAVLVHPDKLPGDDNNRSAFDKVSQAYDVLSDETKRQIYNRHGKRGLEQQQHLQQGAAGSPEDLFRSFFFGGGNRPPPQAAPPRRNRTMRYQLEVTLEDLYEGMTRTVLVSSPPSGLYRSSSSSKRKRVTVQVPRGALDGQSVRLSGQVDFDETETPGDLIFVLQQRPHGMFTRKGYDLAVSVPIRLQEAVTGVQRSLRHLNGKEIVLTSPGAVWNTDTGTTDTTRAGVIQNGQVQVLKGYGMPKDNQGKEFGDLYVQYQVEMPSAQPKARMTPEERRELHRLLDKLEGRKTTTTDLTERPTEKDDDSVMVLEPAVLSDFGHASGTPEVVHPQDDEEDESFRPFGRRGFAFHTSHSFGGGPFHPFSGGMPHPGMYQDDDGGAEEDHAQCRQM